MPSPPFAAGLRTNIARISPASVWNGYEESVGLEDNVLIRDDIPDLGYNKEPDIY